MRVHIQGAGKVGKAFASHLAHAGWRVTLRAATRGPPRGLHADVVLLAVRDGQIPREVQRWREASAMPAEAVVLHLAGALGADALDGLRSTCRGVGKIHPLLSFASGRACPDLEGALALISGDPAAARMGESLAQALGLRARRGEGIDRKAYHAAAWLVAGGAVALSQAAKDLLQGAGFDAREAELMLAPLLRSVGANLQHVGLPEALTGVVRRGDVDTLRGHATTIEALAPEHLGLYLTCANAQLPMARALGDASEESLDALEAEMRRRRAPSADSGRSRSERKFVKNR